MPKKIGIALLTVFVIILFVVPVRKYVTNLFTENKREIAETKIIGPVSGYNSRVKDIQNILEDLGFDLGSIDGRMGSRTRMAIKEFQKSKGLVASGKIDSKTWSELNKEKERMIESVLNPKIDSDFLVDSQASISINDTPAKPALEKVSQKSSIQDEVISYRLKSKDRIRRAQIALQKAGFYKGEIDGKLGPQTKKAIKAFQKSKGLNPDGIVGIKTREELIKFLKD